MSATIPSLPFGGETLSSFDPSSSSVVEGGTHNTPYSTNALTVPPGNTATSPIWPSAPVFWCHYCLSQENLPFNPTSNDFHLDFYSGSTLVMRVLVSGETTFTFAYYTLQGNPGSASLQLVGSMAIGTFSAGALTYDVGITSGINGSLLVANGGTIQVTASHLNHSSWSGVTQVVHRAFGDSFGTAATAAWSQVIWANFNTIGSFLWHAKYDTYSLVNVGWGGVVGDINEIPTTDANPIAAASTGLTSTFYQGSFAPSGTSVLAFIVASRMLSTGTPSNIQMAVRFSGVNYRSPSIVAGAGYQASGYGWTTNPATGVPWAFGDITGANTESGVGS